MEFLNTLVANGTDKIFICIGIFGLFHLFRPQIFKICLILAKKLHKSKSGTMAITIIISVFIVGGQAHASELGYGPNETSLKSYFISSVIISVIGLLLHHKKQGRK